MAPKNEADSIDHVRGQLETIERYITRDIDRIDEAITDLYQRLNEIDKTIQNAKGAWIAIGVISSLVGTGIGWALQIALN